MLEASLWVAGGLALAQVLQRMPPMPAGYAISCWTVFGSMLLGVGAWVGGACVFGAIARFVRTRVAPVLVPLVFRARAARRLMFRTISQTGVRYRDSPLSEFGVLVQKTATAAGTSGGSRPSGGGNSGGTGCVPTSSGNVFSDDPNE